MIKKKKGFTLLELLIVVIIIGILASMAIPQYQRILVRSKTAEALTNLGVLRGSMDRYWYDQVAGGDIYVPLDVLIVGNPINGLDIDNPNGVPDRKWNYGIDDDSNPGDPALDDKDFVIEAQMLNNDEVWVQIDELGAIRSSLNGDDRHRVLGDGGL